MTMRAYFTHLNTNFPPSICWDGRILHHQNLPVNNYFEISQTLINEKTSGRNLTKLRLGYIIADIKHEGVIMQDENGSVTVTAVVQDTPSFLTDEVQLKKLSKELGKATKEAIDVLLAMLKSKDEKIQMQAAIKLLEFDIDVKKAISQDQMQRLIAEIKLARQGNQKQIPVGGDGGGNKPIVDFHTIREV